MLLRLFAVSSLRNLIVKVASYFSQLIVAQMMTACCRADVLRLRELVFIVRLEEQIRRSLVLKILLLTLRPGQVTE